MPLALPASPTFTTLVPGGRPVRRAHARELERRGLVFRERLGRARLAASATVPAGIVLLNVGFG